jgi:glycosyltransferase involved in cell wall biosynthesis
MASAKAIVSTAVDGCREILVDGASAVLVPPRDPAALAAALVRVVEDPRFRRALAEAARLASAAYDIQQTVGKMEALYDDLLEPRAH